MLWEERQLDSGGDSQRFVASFTPSHMLKARRLNHFQADLVLRQQVL
jgi:hypothetical protein